MLLLKHVEPNAPGKRVQDSNPQTVQGRVEYARTDEELRDRLAASRDGLARAWRSCVQTAALSLAVC